MLEKNKKKGNNIIAIIVIVIVVLYIAICIDSKFSENGNNIYKQIEDTFNLPKTFKIISSQENKGSEVIITTSLDTKY